MSRRKEQITLPKQTVRAIFPGVQLPSAKATRNCSIMISCKNWPRRQELQDVSWIEPGQVAWDWWNNLNISRVDFKAGMNTPTYKYYIDFAAANKIKYIIIDGGWSISSVAGNWSPSLDIKKVIPGLNLQEIIDYGNEKGVGVIIWASWSAVIQQMDIAFPLYSKMGVKGFQIDFVDRDDQVAVASLYKIAEKAAECHLLVDYHGVFKPTGLQRTYPNVVGYEGVKGLENYKWADEDQPRYICKHSFYTHDGRSDGLYSGCDEKFESKKFQSDKRQSHE